MLEFCPACWDGHTTWAALPLGEPGVCQLPPAGFPSILVTSAGFTGQFRAPHVLSCLEMWGIVEGMVCPAFFHGLPIILGLMNVFQELLGSSFCEHFLTFTLSQNL